ncbi:MAG: hypothetical protein BZY87_08935 [SAR202 cluster bacterium Io17-Chloro-G6]|nr:MAG: hypothetical protein BZY87_08935 [SAR202 cluster bacterium Io17-Chloro-G6]
MATLKSDTITMNIHRGSKGGYAIVADKYPIFAFGKTIGIAHARFIKACHAYGGSDPQQNVGFGVGSSASFDQPIYGTSFMR